MNEKFCHPIGYTVYENSGVVYSLKIPATQVDMNNINIPAFFISAIFSDL
jgi:hypothetical protein